MLKMSKINSVWCGKWFKRNEMNSFLGNVYMRVRMVNKLLLWVSCLIGERESFLCSAYMLIWQRFMKINQNLARTVIFHLNRQLRLIFLFPSSCFLLLLLLLHVYKVRCMHVRLRSGRNKGWDWDLVNLMKLGYKLLMRCCRLNLDFCGGCWRGFSEIWWKIFS